MSSAGFTKTESDGKRPSSNKNGDWTCPEPDCKNLNFARRNQCNRCGKERPNSGSKNGSTASDSDGGGSSSAGGKKKVGTEIGKAAADKSRGLFSAEDWQCNKCANVNWARRHTCNICSAPRFCDVEERTGYGGGYNDRGVVEYKDRVESDDEFDEFGRRKKPKVKPKESSSRLAQRRRSTDSEEEPNPRNNARKEPQKRRQPDVEPADDGNEEDDEEEDDEDEGDEDLSKYNLWGSDEETGVKPPPKISNTATNHSKQASHHHHRSRSNSRSRSRSPDRRRRSSDQRSSSKSTASSTSHGRSDSKRSSTSRRHGRSGSRSYSRSRSRSRSRSPRSYRRNKDRRR